MKRKTIVILTVFCVFAWGSTLVLKAHRADDQFFSFDQPTMLVIQLDVGQGDALLVISPDRKVTLVDTGPVFRHTGRVWNAGREVILPILRGLGLERIDHLILTHHDQDHLGGVLGLLGAIPIGSVYNNGRGQLTRGYQIFMDRLKECEVPLMVLREGDHLELGQHVFAQVLSPALGIDLEENDDSLVIRLSFGNFEMLLTGDIEGSAERELCLRYGSGLACDFLKVPHHGSKTSSQAYFLAMAQPQTVGISAGRHNPYGHPSPMILKRYEDILKCRVFRTDLDGSILFITNGLECYAATQKGWIDKIRI